IEELDIAHPDDRRAALLLLDPQRSGQVRRHTSDPGLAPGREQVADLLALPGPAGHGGRGAVFEIIGVRDYGDGAGPVLGHRLHGGAFLSQSLHGVSRSEPAPWPYNAASPFTLPARAMAGPVAWPSM